MAWASRSSSPTTIARGGAADLADGTTPLPYPSPELCGTGVVRKLGGPFSAPITGSSSTLDLVTLATIADVVPLVDENRALASAGRARATPVRAGRASRRSCGARVWIRRRRRGGGRIRLAPEINAAGRLQAGPDIALELRVLTEDDEEAKRLAGEPSRS